MMYKVVVSLHNDKGQRKYLNQEERLRFFEVTQQYDTSKRLFCQLLFYTGARIAEVHNLKTDSIDLANGTVVLETLKKRKRGIYREIPLPEPLLNDLQGYVGVLGAQGKQGHCLWTFSLRTGSRLIKASMKKAGISGVRSCARGLRHGFAVHAVNKVPLTMVKKWLGHASLTTTAIYLDIFGEEEREIAKRIW
ncbi:site-specific integrase [Flavobacterium arcticum]|uniref:Site-specific integrase n=1 Tax=Flavobacterium arcticum TaxID=1784713 RepID=A0A345H8T5_9FLAO|nr:site-specific integrase [Flavobacterium arcticum]AXG72995.1 site-specific integrase [Flavobacterium arcticum]KAF2510341.1 site-specific integrase [Flavobacterium arcticum]